jgi:hypothetical protein
MLLVPLIGTVISQDADMIVMQEDDGVCQYSKRFYRLPHDQDHVGEPVAVLWTQPLPVKLEYSLHAILTPARL